MDLQRLQQMLGSMGGRGGGNPNLDTPMPDTAEKIQISSLSLLKMLKHGNVSLFPNTFNRCCKFMMWCIYFFV
jgi:hypothetical protein